MTTGGDVMDAHRAHVEHGSSGCTCVTDHNHPRFGEDPECPHHGYEAVLRRLENDYEKAVEERDRYRDALRFYADLRNHRGVGTGPVYNDRGRVARQAVGACESCRGYGWTKTGRRVLDQDGAYDETVTCTACRGSGTALELRR
jgi:hypothetical protein